MQKELIDIGAVIRHAAARVQRAHADRLKIDLDLPKDTIHVYADRDLLVKCFHDLYSGMLQIVGTGITVEGSVKENGRKLHLRSTAQELSDQAENRAGDDPGPAFDGPGTILQQHGGTIRMMNGVNNMVELPLAVVPQRSQKEAMQENPDKCKVLVVDDNVDGAVTLSVILKHMGNSVRITHDGNSALAVGAEFIPDLILMDIGMPGMDGYETCEKMRAQEWSNNVRIVALTGWGQEEDKRKARRAGFDLHLVKPVDRKTLMEVIASTREGRSLDRSHSEGDLGKQGS